MDKRAGPSTEVDKMDIMNVDEAAGLLGVSTRWIRRRAKSGELPAYHLGPRTLRFSRRELLDWMEGRRKSPGKV